MQLSHCTFTGVDDATDLSQLAELSGKSPIVEWGFLYSPKRQGSPGRYPSVATMRRAFQELPAFVRVAWHVCGQGVADLLEGEAVATELALMVGARQGRIQLNFNQGRAEVDLAKVGAWLAERDGVTVITQHNSANAAVYEALLGHGNHAVLFDASGGQGLSPDAWPAALPGTSCGYAGGLGPGSLQVELDRIAQVAAGRVTWVDMEGRLRSSDAEGVDRFNLQKCRDCLLEVNSWITSFASSTQTRMP